jgi:glycosyltransferase involved in cell wall biosynthesis
MADRAPGPRVSVLLPVRDAERTLAECLDSLTAQTLDDYEVVAVDDGSRDASPEILRRRAASDPRLRVVATPRCGLVAALNTGLSCCRGGLVARMDADDVADPRRLELQAERLEAEPAITALGCRVGLLSPPGYANAGMRAYVAWQNGLIDPATIERDLWVESPLVHPSVMLRAAALRSLGGYRSCGGPEDYDLWLRGYQAGWRFAKHPESLLGWRDAPGRLTRNDPRYAAERFRDVKIDALSRGPLASGRGVVLWGAGPIGKGWSRALRAAGHRVAAFVEVHPRRIGARVHGVPVVDVAGAARFRGPLHLAAVGQPGARETIRGAARELGLVEGRELIAVA